MKFKHRFVSLIMFMLPGAAMGQPSDCDLHHAFEMAKAVSKSAAVQIVAAEERRSTDQGFWNIRRNSQGVVSIEREDNNE